MTPRQFLLCIFALFLGLVAPRGLAAGVPTIALDGIFIALKPGTDAQSYFGAEMSRVTTYVFLPEFYFLTLNASSEQEIYKEIERRLSDPRVKSAEPNHLINITPPDPNPGGVITLSRMILPGLYTGAVKVRRVLSAENLSDQYTLRAQARVTAGNKITILINVPESPASAAESNPAIKVVVDFNQLGETNCMVDGQYPGKVIATGNSLKLTYSVTAVGDGTTTPEQVTRTYEFSLRQKVVRL